jgi:GNAT superfamily N-acetyltransferase
MYRVVESSPAMVDQLEQVQRLCFPTLAEDELILAKHYAAHIERFPAGQFAVTAPSGEVVACSTDFRTTPDFEHFEHRYIDAVDGNWLGNHEPEGQWLYGADIGVVPEHRGRGVAKLLYRRRQDRIRELNLQGHVAGGLLAGYGKFIDVYAPEHYVEKVIAGNIFDPTLSVQLRRGFEVHGIIQDYVDDPSCGNKAAFIVWNNPDWRPPDGQRQ